MYEKNFPGDFEPDDIFVRFLYGLLGALVLIGCILIITFDVEAEPAIDTRISRCIDKFEGTLLEGSVSDCVRRAGDNQAKTPFKFQYGNDFLIPGGLDRNLTSVVGIEYGEWGIGNEMYTPTDKEIQVNPVGDRPFDGYSFIQNTYKTKVGFGQERNFVTRVGAVGHASYTDKLQRSVHGFLEDLGKDQTYPSYKGQNASEFALDVDYSQTNREYLQSFFGDTRMTSKYGFRAGNVEIYPYLDQELRKHFLKHLDIFAGLNGKIVFFNTHLDGRMFHDDYYTVDKQWFVASARVGFELRFDDTYFGYHYQYLTEEFEGQQGRHLYGTFTIGTDF